MGRTNDHVTLGASHNRLRFFGRRLAPQQKYHSSLALGHGPNNFIRHSLPPLVLVTIGVTLAYRHDGIDHQDALFGPTFQKAVRWLGVKIFNLFVFY